MKTGYESTRERRGLRQELRAYITILEIIAITAILLLGFHTINQLDEVMSQQAIQDKTISDAMDQLMWIRQDIDELKNTEAEIADLSDFNLTEDERTLVERIVASESRGESVEGMMAVAQVIRDRSQLGFQGTIGSLFDGIGGFPLVWERLCGKESALWASEIEPFPILVTKNRFYGE